MPTPDRQSNGERIPTVRIADLVARSFIDWRGVSIIATILAESGGYEWIRPMVIAPGKAAHLSIDRGICQFNSHWWSHIPDKTAFNPSHAIFEMCLAVTTDSWAIDLSLWKGYSSGAYYAHMSEAREAMNDVRAVQDLPPL